MSKTHFPRSQAVAYLDTAAEGLPPDYSEQALISYLRDKSLGTTGRKSLYEMEWEVSAAAAQLLHTSPDNIVLLANASDALNLLANSLDWQDGDEVLISDLEFPSNVLTWLRLREAGVRVHVLRSDHGLLRASDFTDRINSSTRLVSVSHVSYKTGTHVPFLEELAQETHRTGGLLCVDATQALGRVPVSVRGVDYLVASSYKWLLGTHGLAVVYLSPELRDRMRPATIGWYSVKQIFRPDRFDHYEYKAGAGRLASGMPNFPSMYALKEGIEYLLKIGPDRLNSQLRPLVAYLRSGLETMGLEVLTPPEPQYASGIVSFAHEDAECVGAALEKERVIVWSGDGRVRASIHLYNDQSDVDCYLSVLQSVLPRCKVGVAESREYFWSGHDKEATNK